MRECLLFCTVVLLLTGCGLFLHGDRFYSHDVTMTLKGGVPCFGLADDEEVHSEQVSIYSIYVQYGGGMQPPDMMMIKIVDGLVLQSGECVPYEGRVLEIDTLYGVGFSVAVENRRPIATHSYGGNFCISENKNGEKILHHFKNRVRSTSCPVSSNE